MFYVYDFDKILIHFLFIFFLKIGNNYDKLE